MKIAGTRNRGLNHFLSEKSGLHCIINLWETKDPKRPRNSYVNKTGSNHSDA